MKCHFKKWAVMGANVALIAIISGCGQSVDRPLTYPVSGTVMYNGAPIAGASVSFWGEGASRAATGVTDADGKFQLSMFAANDGAIAGTHTITVSKVEAGTEPAVSTDAMLNDPSALAGMGASQAKANKGPKSAVPKKYGDRQSTTLKETVSADSENTFVLQLAD